MEHRRSTAKLPRSFRNSALGRLSMLLVLLVFVFEVGCQHQSTTTAPERTAEHSADPTLDASTDDPEADSAGDMRVDLQVQPDAALPEQPGREVVRTEPIDAAPPAQIADASTTTKRQPARQNITVVPGVIACQNPREVRVDATVCIEAGWLEQIACTPATREHEALVVIDAKPSAVHTALLAAGFQSGRPGYWTLDEQDEYLFETPVGDALRIDVAWTDAEGVAHEHPIERWIRDHRLEKTFPDCGWTFGGSVFEALTEGGEPQYIADLTGSIIGLVTFGDEVIGFSKVLSDQEAVQAPEWEADVDSIPPVGTKVTLIIRPLS